MAAVMIYSRFIRSAGIPFCAVFLLCLLAFPLSAQDLLSGQNNETTENQPWQSPDITSLGINWWDSFDTDSADEFLQLIAQFRGNIERRHTTRQQPARFRTRRSLDRHRTGKPAPPSES